MAPTGYCAKWGNGQALKGRRIVCGILAARSCALRRTLRRPLIVAILSQELVQVWRKFHLANIWVRREDGSQECGAFFDAEGIRRFAVIAHKRQQTSTGSTPSVTSIWGSNLRGTSMARETRHNLSAFFRRSRARSRSLKEAIVSLGRITISLKP